MRGVPTQKPVSEWFRRPRLYELARLGDWRQWLYIAEPELHQGCYGVWYRVSGTQEACDPISIPQMHREARAELFRRIRAGGDYAAPEGSDGSAFVWIPDHVLEGMG